MEPNVDKEQDGITRVAALVDRLFPSQGLGQFVEHFRGATRAGWLEVHIAEAVGDRFRKRLDEAVFASRHVTETERAIQAVIQEIGPEMALARLQNGA